MNVGMTDAQGSPNDDADRMVRVLLVADTHIGFDKPRWPRVERRRRGEDFEANFVRALEPALRGDVDLVVHGGDLLFRSRVPPGLVEDALAPLVSVAAAGVPVYLVPGNHERSRIPRTLFTSHPNIHIFHEPCTYVCGVGGLSVALVGFPFMRHIGAGFHDALAATGWVDVPADIRLLCMHQSVEGARVGPNDYTFRPGPDVLAGADVPVGFAAVLSGHIHRSQLLTHDLRGRSLSAPVVYPGSVERTSFSEAEELKHYVVVRLAPDAATGGRLDSARFVPLPVRPMVRIRVDAGAHVSAAGLSEWLRRELTMVPDDAVVRVHVDGELASEVEEALTASHLRAMVPASVNISARSPSPIGNAPSIETGLDVK